MRKDIEDLVNKTMLSRKRKDELIESLLILYNVSKRHLLESLLEDMKGKHSEYHSEIVEDYLDDGC